MQIQINGKAAADAWVERARGLNEETESLLKDVSNLLTSVRNFSEGTLVDEIVELGDGVITATTALMSGMNQIYDVVNKLLDFLKNLFEEATGFQSDSKSAIM